MTSAERRDQLQHILRGRVGGFFHNTRRLPGTTCSVCTGPATAPLCSRCARHRREFADLLADRVLTLTYVRGRSANHQSEHTVYAYKDPRRPSAKGATDLTLMVRAATELHGECVASAAGRAWSAVTFVPSRARPGLAHPVAQFTRQVVGPIDHRDLVLDLGPSIGAQDRDVLPDRFTLATALRRHVAGRHVLILDDTWTTGAKAQSAALAIRAAGAEQVTVLCIARYCRDDWPDHRALLDACTEPYDAGVCPVTGEGCPR